MKMIYKYRYQMKPLGDLLKMPKGAEILSIQLQNSIVYVWAMVDNEAPMVDCDIITICMCGTGQIIPKDISEYKYITTLQMSESVWHFFQRRVV